jgi:hypothetical protein
MAVNLTTLYDRLGKLFGISKAQIDARTGLLDRVTGSGAFSGVGLDAQYTASTRYMVTPVLDYFLNLYRSADPSIQRTIAGGVKTLTEMVTADNANIPKNVIAALNELNRQMRAASTSLLQNTITQGSVSYAGSNVGNGKVLLHGTPSQMSPSETLTFQCISDTTTGTTSGREIFRVTGGLRTPDVTSYNWPGGSGAAFNLASSDYVSSDNTLTNGGFDSWTSGTLNNWTFTTGVANASQLTSGTFRGGSAIQINGATQTAFSQTGSNRILGPNRRIIFGFWAKRVSGSAPPATPIIGMGLTDAATGSTLASVDTDTGGPAISTSWNLYSGSYINSFYAPTSDITVDFDINPGVANVYAIDCAFVYAPTQAGVNGQFLQIIGGSTDWRIGDYATVQITNNYASTVLAYTERFFAPFANGIELPTSGSPTINNTVIP